MHFAIYFRLLALACTLGLVSCESYKSEFMLCYTQLEAQGIQPVRSSPPTLGYRRLKAYGTSNDTIKLFLQAKGYPDYIIEQHGLKPFKMFCYYISKNQAYLVQSTGNYAPSTRILGPDPIGEKDKKFFISLAETEREAASYQQ
jgi:hypothetical protein